MNVGHSRPIAAESTIAGSRWKFAWGRWIIRTAALLYSVYFFLLPAYHHPLVVWIEFGAFYAVFLLLYFAVGELKGPPQAAAFVLFFLLPFLFYPLNREAAGMFVFPFAMLCLFLTRLRDLSLVLAGLMAAVTVETRNFEHTFTTAESIFFFCVILGLSNFAFAQQTRTNALLECANAEIERLSQEAERERIARDLHDLLGHTLTAIAVKLDLARRLLPREPDRARNEIVEAEQTARTALAEVREAVSGYRAEGLAAEIARARRSLHSTNVALTTSLAPVSLSSDQVNVLCLVLREAVTNIVRHAHATSCHIALSAQENTLLCSVADDGVGASNSEGNGLRGMRERIQSAGGTIKLTSTTGAGTRVEFTLPVNRPSSSRKAPQIAGEADTL